MKSRNSMEEDIELIEKKHQQLEEKFLSLKIDPGGITYGLVGLLRRLEVLKRGKKVKILREFIKENLEMESKAITIKRAHRTGSKINGKERAIIANLLNYKCKYAVPIQTKIILEGQYLRS